MKVQLHVFLTPTLGEGNGEPDAPVTWKNLSVARDMGEEGVWWSGSLAGEKNRVSS
jgi:hypothetical protein